MRPDPRLESSCPPLDEADAPADPFTQFERWFEQAQAAEPALPEAMALATVTREGRPDARIVLLKDVDAGGFVFFTNYDSRKGEELGHCPHAALVFHWKSLERQVRIEGAVEIANATYADAYFATRPLGSRHGAQASPQSQIIPSRAWLQARFDASVARYGENVPRPANWGGYRVKPSRIEFWQGRDDRLHDRLLYRLQPDGTWTIARLAP